MNDVIVTIVFYIGKVQFNKILSNKDIIPITGDYININDVELTVNNRKFIYQNDKLEQILINCKL